MPANLLDEPEREAERAGLPLDAQLRARSTRPRTRRCGSILDARRRDGSSRRRPTSATCTRASRSSASTSNFNQYVTIVDRKNYISPPLQRDGLAPRGREAARHRADAALQVHPRRSSASWPGSATTCSAPGPRRSTSGRSRRSSTPSTSASRSTTSTRRCRATASTRATPASAACCTTSTTGSIDRVRDVPRRASPRSTPTWRSCSSATGSSSTGPGASAC